MELLPSELVPLRPSHFPSGTGEIGFCAGTTARNLQSPESRRVCPGVGAGCGRRKDLLVRNFRGRRSEKRQWICANGRSFRRRKCRSWVAVVRTVTGVTGDGVRGGCTHTEGTGSLGPSVSHWKGVRQGLESFTRARGEGTALGLRRCSVTHPGYHRRCHTSSYKNDHRTSAGLRPRFPASSFVPLTARLQRAHSYPEPRRGDVSTLC